LHRFYPNAVPLTEKLSAPARSAEYPAASPPADSFGTVVVNEPKGAEIWLDNAFVGSVPARLKLTAVQHLIVIKVRGHADWTRSITVQKDSEVTLQPELP
jgi:PEGA domain